MTELIEYLDAVDGTRGWLAYDGGPHSLAAGGCRVQAGLDGAQVATLASRMTLKQRVLGLNVDGAKCGIDRQPGAEGRAGALRRFVAFLADELSTRFSMGPDMGTEWTELQRMAADAGVPSTKYAIKKAQGLSDGEFFARLNQLNERVGLLTLGQRRAGHALAHVAVGAARAAGVAEQGTYAVQGFGTLGRAAAYSLFEEGLRMTAVADEQGGVTEPDGLDVVSMLRDRQDTPVPLLAVEGARIPREALFDVPADVLVLAGSADAMDERATAAPPFATVAVGANCGLSEAAEDALHARGVFVVPDFIGGIGGSASMEVLFGPRGVPSAAEVLDSLAHLMRELVNDLASVARREDLTPREAALRLAGANAVELDAPPYGHCPYLLTRAG